MDDIIICPELEDYRIHLNARKIKQSKGGKIGSAITNKKRNKSIKTEDNEQSSNSTTNSSSDLQVSRQVPRRGSDESLVQHSTVQHSIEKHSTTPSLDKEVLKDPFVSEMEEYEVNEGINDKKRFMRI